MRVFNFAIQLEDAMADTLERLSLRNDLSPRQFAEQLIEVRLAEYRLPRVVEGPYGPRMYTETE